MTEINDRWQLRQLSRERAPTRDLWPGIAASIAQPQQTERLQNAARGRWWRTFGSALVASLVLGAFGLGLARPRLLEMVGLRRATPEHQLVLKEAAAIRKQYQVELRQFRNKPVSTDITPALIELDQSADNIMVALNSHPDAVFLLDQLRRTYARRLQLTQRVAMF
ncbi:MAG TPA: hypothetical protein VGT79_10730 [Xanthomonadaceae bacterium]|nr:hypothetical protein [Xanthomonadaceae bacterium]